MPVTFPDSSSVSSTEEYVSDAPGQGCDLNTLADRLAAEMAERWRKGERPAAEEFLARHPELCEQPAAAAELIYEEFCLRLAQDETVSSLDFLQRFPQWRDQLAVLLDCARILDADPASPRMPAVGETLGDFRLLAELGRGALGRVYLAAQRNLADRPVVLKVTPNDGREHLSLARLQHTHIVPLYSVQEDPARDLRVLCMPYFGGTTLARVLEMLGDRPVHHRRGIDILDSLDKTEAAAPVSMPARGPAWQFLVKASYVEAVCSLGACLADALQYAHARGLLHLDLKPSNVLVTYDGQPMLLDFHLAREPIQPGASAAEQLGGTVGYMSPEQQLALAAVREGRKVPLGVDRRSDVYSLGLILYQSLGGAVPLPAGPPPRLDQCNPHVFAGLADIIAKCLASNPDDRYGDAASLGADLRRHLADLPLHGVPNRSFAERWRKWRRRRPHTLPLAVMVLAVLAAAAAVGIITRANVGQRFEEARTALDEGKRDLDDRRYTEAVATLKRGLSVAEALPSSRDLRAEIGHHLGLAERGQLVDDLHTLADRIRFLDASDFTPSDALHAFEARCLELWEKRALITDRLGSDLGPESKARVQADLLDVAILWSDLHVRLAAPNEAVTARHDTLRVLDEAEALAGPSPVLCLERQHHAEALGLTELARNAATRANELVPSTAWEHYALGRLLLRGGNLEDAAKQFDRATALEPAGLWPSFYQGVCCYRIGRYEDAVAAFSTCIGAAPQLAVCFYNRALAYTPLGRLDHALRDYDHAIQLDPHLAVATFNRGIVHYREKRYAEAMADLERALADGVNPAAVHYNLALIHFAQNDRAAALASLQRSLDHDPAHKESRDLRQRLLHER